MKTKISLKTQGYSLTISKAIKKKVAHPSRVIQEGDTVQRTLGGVGGVHSAQSFELKLHSFAHSSDRATDWLLPLGLHGTAAALRLGVERTGLWKTSVFPKAGLRQFSRSSNTVFSEQGRNRLIRIFP